MYGESGPDQRKYSACTFGETFEQATLANAKGEQFKPFPSWGMTTFDPRAPSSSSPLSVSVVGLWKSAKG